MEVLDSVSLLQFEFFAIAAVLSAFLFSGGFLLGRVSSDGWWYFFPVTFLLKTPVPLHWTRLFQRRYNQAALLAQAIRSAGGPDVALHALHRPAPLRQGCARPCQAGSRFQAKIQGFRGIR